MARFVGALAALSLAAASSHAAAEPVTLDTLLALEAFGQIGVAPGGRRIVVERQRALGALPRYDYGFSGALRYADLFIGELGTSSPLVALLPTTPDTGYTLGAFSPDGRRLAIHRLQGDQWKLGIVELETGAVVWTEVAPLTAEWGRALEWASNEHLIVLGTPDGGLPHRVAEDRRVQDRLPVLWRATSRGEASFALNETGPGRSSAPAPGRSVLWSINASTGAAAALAEGDLIDLELSYDGRTAAIIVDGPTESVPADGLVQEPRRKRSLLLVDLATGELRRPAAANDIAATLLAWSPQTSDLLVYSRDGTGSFLRMSSSGVARPVSLAPVIPTVPLVDGIGYIPSAGWLNNRPIVYGRVSGAERSDWWALDADGPANLTAALAAPGAIRAQHTDGVVIADGEDLVALDATGRTTLLGRVVASPPRSTPPSVRSLFGPMKTDFVLARTDGLVCRIGQGSRRCGAASGDPVLSVTDDSVVLSVSNADDGSRRLLAAPPNGEPASVLMTLNPELAEVDFPQPRRVTGPNGASGWVYLPAGEGPFPVVAIPYPGKVREAPPEEMRPGSRSAMWTGQLLVSAGYAVVYPDLAERPDPSEALADRILSVIDAAAGSAPIDRDRIGLWGWSFGAWAAVLAAAQSNRIDAVVALNGPYDRLSTLGTTSVRARMDGGMQSFATDNARWLETGQAGMAATYWVDPERYRRNSAVELADRISAPILIMSGEMDFGIAQGELLFGALNRLDRRAALITFFGEEHGLVSPGNISQMHAQAIGWFDRYLRDNAASTPGAIASDAATPRRGPS